MALVLRVMYYTDTREGERPYVGRLLCSACGKAMDMVTQEEVDLLGTGDFGVPFCPRCEREHCSQCGGLVVQQRELREMKRNGGVCSLCEWHKRGVIIWKMVKWFQEGHIMGSADRQRLSSILISQQALQETAGQGDNNGD